MSESKKPYFLVGFDPSQSSTKLALFILQGWDISFHGILLVMSRCLDGVLAMTSAELKKIVIKRSRIYLYRNIPWRFLPYLEGRTSGIVFLDGPSDNTWHASLVQTDDGLFFHDGWETFVIDNFLEQGDSLVFRYDGELNFTVQVFDKSSCEKEDAFNAICSQVPTSPVYTRKRKRSNTTLCSDTAEAVPTKLRSSQLDVDCITKNHGNGTYPVNTEMSLQQDMTCMDERNQTLGYIDEMFNVGNASKDSDNVSFPLKAILDAESSDIEASTMNEFRTDFRMMSAAEAERIVSAFTSPFPNFTKVMKRFNISGSYTLNIPYQFATAHFPNCKIKITLSNLKGKSWTINSIPTTRVQTAHTFCGGWLAFVRDNNINEGDTCIFELVRQFKFQVRILRVENFELENLSNDVIQKETFDCGAATLPKRSGRKTKKLKGYSHGVYSQPVKVCSGELVKVCSGELDANSIQRHGSQAKGCMSLKSMPEEKLAAASFVSSYPHFVKVMKKFNISGSYTLKIPYQFSMEHLPCCKTEIILRNLKGQCWTVNSIPTIKVQTLHTFCGGWMAFVRGNLIQLGDICIFELVGRCEMRVHVCSIGSKGLEYQSGRACSDESPIGFMSSSSCIP